MKKKSESNYYEEYEIDLREYIMLLWRNKAFIITLTVLAVLVSYFYSVNFISPQYKNSLTIQLANTEGIYSKTETMNELLKSDELIKTALDKNNLDNGVIAGINTTIKSELKLTEQGMQGAVYGGIIDLEAESAKPQKLYKALNIIVDEFQKKSNDYFENVLAEKNNDLLTIENEIINLGNEIDKTNKILNNLENISMDKAFIIANINDKLNTLSKTKREYLKDYRGLRREINDHRGFRVLNFPAESSVKTAPNIRLNIAIAAVLGLMLSVFIVFFKEYLKEE